MAGPSSVPSLWSSQAGQTTPQPAASGLDNNPVGEIVGLLALSSSEAPAYVGSSSGLSLAANLGEMVQSSVWNQFISRTQQKPKASPKIGPQSTAAPTPGTPQKPGSASRNRDPKSMRLEERVSSNFEPPSDEMGSQMLEVYFKRLHSRYPFLDRRQTWRLHEERRRLVNTKREDLTRSDRFAIFKLNLLYAIGATMLQTSEKFDYTTPEVSLAQAM